MVAKVPAFVTDDGKLFRDEREAVEHEVRAKLDKCFCITDGDRRSTWTLDETVEFLLANAEELTTLLSRYHAVFPRVLADTPEAERVPVPALKRGGPPSELELLKRGGPEVLGHLDENVG